MGGTHCETGRVVKSNPKHCKVLKLMESVVFRDCAIYHFLRHKKKKHQLVETFLVKYVTKIFEKIPTQNVIKFRRDLQLKYHHF